MKNRIATLVMLLGLEGVLWVTTEASAPKIAQADTARLNLSLDRQPNETYESLVRRAEAVATAATQARFGQDSGVEDVSVTVAAQNQGQIVPVLSLQVSRSQWYGSPYTKPWAKYFANAKALLRFENAATNTSAPTQATNPASRQGIYPNRSNRYPGSRYPGYPSQNYPAQPGNSNPYNQYSPRTPQTGYPGQVGNTNTGAPNQTPNASSGMVPQAPISVPAINPGSASAGSTSTGSNSTPTPPNLLPIPAAPSSTSGGTTSNNSSTTGLSNSSGTTSNNYPTTTPSYRGGTTINNSAPR